MRLRYEETHKSEISEEHSSERCKGFKSVCIILKDYLNYYIDSSEKSDVLNVNNGDDFHEYEQNRSGIITKAIWHVYEIYTVRKDKMTRNEQERFSK